MSLDLGALALRLTAKDETKKGFDSARRNTDQFVSDASRKGKQAGDKLGDGFGNSFLGRIRQTVSKYAQAGQQAGQKLSEGIKSGTSDGQSAILSLAGKAGLGLLAASAVRTGIQTAAGMETARMGFTTMLGSAKQADVFLKQLADFAAKTPFEFPELQTAAQSLISAGVQADKVIPIMRTLGDVTAGMGTGAEGVERATVAIQQMNAAGRITAEDLNQLRDAGIPVYDLLAAATGRSKAEVAGLAQAGKLGKTELDAMMKALESGAGLERFNGLMAQTSTSLSGLWSTLQDTFSQGMANAIQPAIPLIKAGLGGAIALISDHLDEAIFAAGAFFAVWSVQKTAGLIGSLSEMTAGFGKLSAGLGKASTFLGGPWGIAIGLAVTVLGTLIAKHYAAVTAAKAFTDTLTFQNGVLDKNSASLEIDKLAKEGALETAKKAGIAESDYVTALIKGGSSRQQMIDQLQSIADRHTVVTMTASGAQTRLDGVGIAAKDAAEKLRTEGAALDDSARASKLADSAAKGLSSSTGTAADKSAVLTSAQSDLVKAEDKLRTETQKLIDKFTILRDGALGSERATSAFEESLDAAKAAVKENGKSLDVHSEKGRANRAVITDMITSLNDKVAADFKSNVETKGLAKATDIASDALKTGKARILESAGAAGYNTGKVKAMQDRMLQTPKELRTQVNTPGIKAAQDNVDTLSNKIRDIKGKTVDIKFRSMTGNFVLTQSADGRTVKVKDPGLADGGTVPGWSPHPKADNIRAWLTAGEEVIPVGPATKHRALLKAISADRFSDGGTVGRAISVGAGRIPQSAMHYPAEVAGMESRLATAIGTMLGRQLKASLAAGGGGITDVSNPRGLTSFRGGTFTRLFAANLRQAEQIAKMTLSVYQGGFRPATPWSGTSHRGDAIDHQPAAKMIRAMRSVGIADGDRTGLGNWMSHAHGVPTKGHGYAAGSAVWQAQDYLRRGGKSQSLRSPWGLWTGTLSAPAGINEVAEEGSELVVNRQFRKFKGGERVFNADETEQLFADAAAGQGAGRNLIKVDQHFPQAMDPYVAADISGARLSSSLEAVGV